MKDLFLLSFRNIFRKGFRTALTVLGISVGVASVLLINTISNVGTKAVNAELDSLGLNGISVSASGNNKLETEDLQTINKIEDVESAMPIITQRSVASEYDSNINVMVWGVGSGVKQVISIEMLYGDTFSKYDIESKENVCLLDENIAQLIFGRVNVVGKEINLLINGIYDNYKIIGITKTGSGILQSVMGDIVPDFCYIPYTTLQQSLQTDELYQIAVKLKDNDNVDEVSQVISNAIDLSKGISGSVETSDLASQRMALTNLLDTVTLILAIVGFISLLVAGLGIMTVMLVSVNERTKEIGIKKAIGASFGTIMSEFLLEALTICFLGSIIGCVVGVSIAFVGGEIYGINVAIDFSSIAVAIIGAVVTGVVFGLYPAFKGARLQPVEALRYE